MATVIPTQAAAGADQRAAIQAAIDGATDGDILRLNNQTSATWIVSGRADPNGSGGDHETLGGSGYGALGAIEFTKAMVLQLDAGITLQESATSPITELNQPLLRWHNKANVGITFGLGSKILGQKALHAEDTEFMAGAKFIGCAGVVITGTNQVHFDGFYGDGLWFASGGAPVLGPLGASTGVVVSNILSSNNLRDGVTIESCVGEFNNVGGTGNIGAAPQACINIETDIGTELVGGTPDTIQVSLNGGSVEGRAHGVVINIVNNLTNPVLITMRNYRSLQGPGGDAPWGFTLQVADGAITPAGSLITAINCESRLLKYAGYRFNWDLATAMKLRLVRCGLRFCSSIQDGNDRPFDFNLTGNPTGGGIEFDDCWYEDDLNRKATFVASAGGTATNVKGVIHCRGPRFVPPGSQLQSLLPNLRVGSFQRRFSKTKTRSASRGTF